MLKVMNEYAPEVGSLQSELNRWSDKVDELASERLEEYFLVRTTAVVHPIMLVHIPLLVLTAGSKYL